ncbi:Bi-functional coumaroyl CoA and feruloyl CoA ortho-hydroxylase F6H2-1-1 [Linum perenne]
MKRAEPVIKKLVELLLKKINVKDVIDTGGLYVKGEEEEGHSWIPVPPVEGALVVNVGDVLQIMSNDLYKSVEHLAFPSKTSNRVSVPIFVNPAPVAIIRVLPEVLESGAKV